MPFTPTHIAAILPIAAVGPRVLPFSALAIGSMIPDLPLFVPWSPAAYGTMHSPMGLVTACLPLGWACFIVFQWLMKRPLFALLPGAVQRRCALLAEPWADATLRGFAGVSLAIVVGAWTHLAWDAFTHEGRWGTTLVPRLNEVVLTVAGHDLPGYKLLQYGSTLVALPAMALLLAAWLYRQRAVAVAGEPALPAGTKPAAYALVLAIPLGVALFVWHREGWSLYRQLFSAVTMSSLALMVLALTYSLVYHATMKRSA
ncbi:MAG: DUF4184 family protein [Phycisphaeraceae bacterium]